jgi:hypothetical protein
VAVAGHLCILYTPDVIEGTLDRLHLGDLLQWLQMGGLSGRLTLIEGGRQRRFDFLDGRVVFASSQFPEERFGTWLAREGVLPAATLRQLLGRSMLRRTLFSDSLIADAGLSAATLCASLTRLAETIATRVLLLSRVRFALDPNYPVRDLLGLDLNLEPHALVMEAARRSDEDDSMAAEGDAIPFHGEEYEDFFLGLIREGVSGDQPLAGEQIAELHQTVRSIMATLAQWLASSPGLVPLPVGQVASMAEQMADSGEVRLHGLPQTTWNQMVLACAIRSPTLCPPTSLEELEQQAGELDVWSEMSAVESWHRPHAARLDEVTAGAVCQWAVAAKAAAPHLKVDPSTAALAVHLVAVPADLVLWALAMLPVGHSSLRQTLQRRIPHRMSAALAQLADFPDELRVLMDGSQATRLGACLHLARQTLITAALWPATLPDPEVTLPTVARKTPIKRAAGAARRASKDFVKQLHAVG